MSTHNLCFEQKYKKYQRFLPEKFRFLEVKFSIYLNRCVFVMRDHEDQLKCTWMHYTNSEDQNLHVYPRYPIQVYTIQPLLYTNWYKGLATTEDKLMTFFPKKTWFDISCKLSPICINIKSYFLGKIRKLFQNVVCWKLWICESPSVLGYTSK